MDLCKHKGAEQAGYVEPVTLLFCHACHEFVMTNGCTTVSAQGAALYSHMPAMTGRVYTQSGVFDDTLLTLYESLRSLREEFAFNLVRKMVAELDRAKALNALAISAMVETQLSRTERSFKLVSLAVKMGNNKIDMEAATTELLEILRKKNNPTPHADAFTLACAEIITDMGVSSETVQAFVDDYRAGDLLQGLDFSGLDLEE